ncbi:uncharacterized protein SOCE836_002260 [Sorangium cellulosum]|uniref:Uncharacterized protein n=1 Tax=Sorangium cellulosum TaxID=56 RepID=A0A4P2QFD7_SORCE|nr:uncharacterized protein SOCE836_002260 [Sorangium cellulosum]
MEDILSAMWLISPIGLAMMACVAIGFAVTAREALGRERGLREAGERSHEEDESALIDAKEKAEQELGRHKRLLDCHVDALIAAMTGVRARPVPWPGRVLEAFCATIPAWQRRLAENTGLAPRDVERLLNSDLPITPGLARQLEVFTGTPARYWERLWRVHEDYRSDAEDTVVIWSSPGSADSLTMPRARSRRSSIRTRSGSCRRAVSAVVSGCRSSRCSLRSMRWRPLASGSARARPAPPSASRRSSRPRRCPSSRRRGSCSG